MLTYVDRRGSDCYKWDSDHARGTLPLWVADMDFEAAPAILDALRQRVEHGVFGYTSVPDSYYDAISRWFAQEHGWQGISRENTICTTGVVPAVSAILRGLSIGKESPLRVTLQTPAYNCFFSSLRNLNCVQHLNPLVLRDHHYEWDWQGLEDCLRESDVLLLCNPHNPTGRVWTRDELLRVAELSHRYGVFVLSDEIHCEFSFPGTPYTPFATVAADTNYCVCTSPSKAFNLAGLQVANIFVPAPALRERIDRGINIHEVCDISPFGIVALQAAYNHSGAWLRELNQLLHRHYRLLVQTLEPYADRLRPVRMEGTYLAWVDIRPLLGERWADSEAFCRALQEAEAVLFNPGTMYGEDGFIRINMATKTENLQEALRRLTAFCC